MQKLTVQINVYSEVTIMNKPTPDDCIRPAGACMYTGSCSLTNECDIKHTSQGSSCMVYQLKHDEDSPDSLKKLINDHWSYVEKLLVNHDIGTGEIKLVEFHYKTAFEHGYKHAKEDM